METTVRHYFVTLNGDAIEVPRCDTARKWAGEAGWSDGTWWVEHYHYGPDGEPVAGGEWPCGCDN